MVGKFKPYRNDRRNQCINGKNNPMHKLLSLFTLSLIFFACGGEPATTDGTTMEASTSTPKNHRSCLHDFTGDLCDLLDPAVVEPFFPGAPEKKSYKSTERSSLSSCGLSYESPTETQVLEAGTLKMTVPVSYTVTINSFRASKAKDPLARFRSTYKTLTAEEAADVRKKMDEGLQAKLDAGEIDQETFENAKGFGGLVGKATYEEVPGLGTAAAWGGVVMKQAPHAADLYVLDGDYTFTVAADMGSREKSKSAAIAVAKSILARCD